MSQPKYNGQWIKMMASCCGPTIRGTKTGRYLVNRVVRPLFWEITERTKQNKWMNWMTDMIRRTEQEKKDGQ